MMKMEEEHANSNEMALAAAASTTAAKRWERNENSYLEFGTNATREKKFSKQFLVPNI